MAYPASNNGHSWADSSQGQLQHYATASIITNSVLNEEM